VIPTEELRGAVSLLRTDKTFRSSRNSPPVTEPETLLPFTEASRAGPYSVPDKSHTHMYILFISDES
jgi:hypothetical protein